ncbi:hypothetical protein GCM10007049_00600 [Echinicola pacifica]|uniref:ABC transporter domain-containing protein n=2 Tax=Echinicola pacifica TaxID=346377 RepID=A0A918PJ62_9BACT|nr:hypothetical protein GCM10007049_00600 [Echinicola pacifica]
MSHFGVDDESVFWALKEVNFEVKEGEVLGIIGKNGAGKSTLLKILSQITQPTSGRITLHGRVASLLEVGTGFHPELSGRENIYMNGTILGMTRREIDRKLDEIIDFSGVEKFIDTPVKFYSSGMKVRLGFSVAAHLEPEILIIDEVLAVGDSEFQQKCLGKMEDVSKNQGRTVLFVSHNMAAVQNLCPKSMILNHGQLGGLGATEDIVRKYLERNAPVNQMSISDMEMKAEGSKAIWLEHISVSSKINEVFPAVCKEDLFLILDLGLKENKSFKGARVDIRIDNKLNQRLIWCSTSAEDDFSIKAGRLIFKIPECPLSPDDYLLTVFIHDGKDVASWYPNLMSFRVQDVKYYDNGLIIPKGQTNFIYPYEIISE